MSLFTEYQKAIIAFCAAECKRQNSGEESVAWMLNAYAYACWRWRVDRTVTEEDILALAKMIEPEKNAKGYRRVNVSFSNLSVVGWENIERQMSSLLAAQNDMAPADFEGTFEERQAASALAFYTELEKIHPLLDGNGRLGAILYNLMTGKLFAPVAPPLVQFG